MLLEKCPNTDQKNCGFGQFSHSVSDYCLAWYLLGKLLTVNCLQSTALYYAAEEGATEAANLLLEYGAKVNAKNSLWDTPLHAACENQRVNTFVEKRVHFTLTFYPDEK